MSPKSEVSRAFRDAVLTLARNHEFARGFVNSGRLSTPKILTQSRLNTSDEAEFAGAMFPGTPCADAPVQVEGQDSWLLEHLGEEFVYRRVVERLFVKYQRRPLRAPFRRKTRQPAVGTPAFGVHSLAAHHAVYPVTARAPPRSPAAPG